MNSNLFSILFFSLKTITLLLDKNLPIGDLSLFVLFQRGFTFLPNVDSKIYFLTGQCFFFPDDSNFTIRHEPACRGLLLFSLSDISLRFPFHHENQRSFRIIFFPVIITLVSDMHLFFICFFYRGSLLVSYPVVLTFLH